MGVHQPRIEAAPPAAGGHSYFRPMRENVGVPHSAAKPVPPLISVCPLQNLRPV